MGKRIRRLSDPITCPKCHESMGAEFIYQCSRSMGGCGREVCDTCFDYNNSETCPYCQKRWSAKCVTSCDDYDWVR